MKYILMFTKNNSEHINKLESVKKRCNCKPSCASISYDTEITQNDQVSSLPDKYTKCIF